MNTLRKTLDVHTDMYIQIPLFPSRKLGKKFQCHYSFTRLLYCRSMNELNLHVLTWTTSKSLCGIKKKVAKGYIQFHNISVTIKIQKYI